MKKLIVLPVILILAAGLCFAQAVEEAETTELPPIEKFDLEVHVGFPVHWTNALHDDSFYTFNVNSKAEDKTVTANTAIGFSTLFNFGRKVGFGLEADFFYSARLAGYATPSADSISMFGANVFLGPVFYLYNGIFLRIPLMVGAHMYYFGDDLWVPAFDAGNSAGGLWMNRKDLQIGPGISLGVQFHFTKSIYVFSRTNVALDVFRWHKVTYIEYGTYEEQTKSDMEFTISWSVKPVLGIGIKF